MPIAPAANEPVAVMAAPATTAAIAASMIERRPWRSDTRATSGVVKPPRFRRAMTEARVPGETPRPRAIAEAVAEARAVMSLVTSRESGIFRLEDVLLQALIHQRATRTWSRV